MKATRHLHDATMSPEDVLAAIRDGYRFSEQLDPESEPGMDLVFESTIRDWRTACDLLGTLKLGRALNKEFGITASDAEWWAVLEPESRATLRCVCEFISAKGARRPVLRPFRVAGRDCLEAGAFLTLRTALADAGVPTATTRPSTSLESMEPYFSELVGVLAKLAPGVMPVPALPPASRLARLSAKAVLGALLLISLVPVVKNWWYSGTVMLSFLLGSAGFVFDRRRDRRQLQYGELCTLGDLARLLAKHHPRAI